MDVKKPFNKPLGNLQNRYRPKPNQVLNITRPNYRYKWVPEYKNGKRRMVLKAAWIPGYHQRNRPTTVQPVVPSYMDRQYTNMKDLRVQLVKERQNAKNLQERVKYWRKMFEVQKGTFAKLNKRLQLQKTYNQTATQQNTSLKKIVNKLEIANYDLKSQTSYHQTAHQNLIKQVLELKTEKGNLHYKIEKMNDTYTDTANQFVSSIISLSKLRNEIALLQFGRKIQDNEIQKLKREQDWEFLGNCMATFDVFCKTSPTSAAQTICTSGQQLMRADGLFSLANHTAWLCFNQLCRFFRNLAGIQLTQPEQGLM